MSSSGSTIVTFLLVVVTSSGDSISILSCAAWCGRHLLRYHVCRRTCLLSRLSAPSLCVTSPCGALIGPPTGFRHNGPTMPCRVGGHGRDRGHDCHVDLSCGRRSYTHSSSKFSTHFKALSSATIGSLRCSSHSFTRVYFFPKMLSLRSGS